MAASATIANLVAKITGDDKDFQKSMGRVEKRLKSLSGLSGQGGPLGTLGKTAQAFRAAPILKGLEAIRQGLQVVVAEAADFERQFKVVQAITSGTGKDFAKLEKQVVALSSSTEITSNNFLKATTVMGRAGFHARDVGVALKTVADLATASGVSTEIAANMAVRMLKSFGKETDELASISDVLAQAAANANVTIRGLAEGFKFAGAIAQQQGFKFNEVTTALSLLGETGLEAGLAGRALQAMIMDLAKPTNNAIRELTKLGVTTHRASGKALPLAVILRQLKESGMSSAQAFTIFNRNSARAVTALTRNVDAFDAFLLKLDEAEGELGKQATTMRDSYNAELDRMSNLFSNIGKAIGDKFLPEAKGAAAGFNSILDAVEGLLKGDKIGSLTLKFAALAGPMGLIAVMVPKALEGVGKVIDDISAGAEKGAANRANVLAGLKGGGKSTSDTPFVNPYTGGQSKNPNFVSPAAKGMVGELTGTSQVGSKIHATTLEQAEEAGQAIKDKLIAVSTILATATKTVQDKFDFSEILGKLDSFDLAQEAKVAFGKVLTKLKNDPNLVNMQGKAFEHVKEALKEYMAGAGASIEAILAALEGKATKSKKQKEREQKNREMTAAKWMQGTRSATQQFSELGGTVTKHQDFGLGEGSNVALSGASRNLGRPGSTEKVGGTFQNEKIFAALENDIINAASMVFEGMGPFILDAIEGFSPAEVGAIGGMVNSATSALGDLGGTINTFASVTAKTGNPMMGAGAALVDMITQTESFGVMSAGLGTIFEAVIGVLDMIMMPLRSLGGLFHIIGVAIKALTPLLGVFQIGMEGLTIVFKGVGYIIGAIVWAIAKVYNALAGALETITFGAIDLKRMDANAVFDAIDEMGELGDETKETKDKFKDLNEELAKSGNIPAGFKTNLRAFQAALEGTVDVARDVMGVGPGGPSGAWGASTGRGGGHPSRMQHGGIVPGAGFGDSVPALLTPGETVVPRGGVAGGVVIQNMVVQVSDTKDFMRKLTREQEWNSMVSRGSPLHGKLGGAR